MKIFLFRVLYIGALKTAPWLRLLSLIEVGDFFGDLGFKDRGLFFVLGNFGVEFVEGFAAGGKDGDGHGRKVFKNLFLFLNFDYILFSPFMPFCIYFAYIYTINDLKFSAIISLKYPSRTVLLDQSKAFGG